MKLISASLDNSVHHIGTKFAIILRSGDGSKLRASTIVHVMNNGHSIVIEGTENAITIYNKSSHAENFIHEHYLNNGLANGDVHRIESRLTWKYIRYLRNRKELDINVESLC